MAAAADGVLRRVGLPLAALLLSAAAAASEVPLPTPRPVERPPLPAGEPAATAGTAGQAASAAPQQPDEASACRADLARRAVFTAVEVPAGPPDCAVERPVRLTAVRIADGRTIALPGAPLLACAFAARFAAFAGDLATPLVEATGARLTIIETGPGFECRRRNRATGGKISAHGHGTAVDVSAFAMADGSRWAVGGPADAPGARTIATIRTAACGWFTTVLGPGSDASHTTHLHLDTEPHGRSERYRICD